jgi:peptide/nickel transport system ATP-binding protein
MLLEVKNCRVEITTMRGKLPAVRGIDLELAEGEILGLVGESGCGKSTAMHALTRINPKSAKATFDYCRLNGVDISKFDDKQLEKVRGIEIAYIFQDPQASLNPIMTIGDQLVEALQVKNPKLTKEESWKKAVELLDSV